MLFADRKSRGLAPYWPSALASLTGYSLSGTPELAAAVNGAQRWVVLEVNGVGVVCDGWAIGAHMQGWVTESLK